jgi:hypothetical protein
VNGEYEADVHWISFEAMVERFYTLNVLMIKKENGELVQYKEYRKPVSFTYNIHTTIPESPYFYFEPKSDSHVIFSIFQEDSRVGKPYIDVGIVILRSDVS